MSEVSYKDGKIPLDIPAAQKPCFTYYKVFGDLNGKPPLVCLHGGPGSTHGFMQELSVLWPRYGIPVIVYDMIGCGQSTNLDDEKAGDESFWQMSLFVDELATLLDFFNLRDDNSPGYHLLGLSFGAKLAAEFAVARPKGLQRLVLGCPISSSDTFMEGIDIRKKELAPHVQQALDEGVRTQNMATEAFRDAYRIYTQHCICRLNPLPAIFEQYVTHATSLNTAVKGVLPTMLGICPIVTAKSIGSLRGWTIIPRLHQITAKTLLLSGEYDQSHEVTVKPFFDHIPQVRWHTFANASHCWSWESEEHREAYYKLVSEFLTPPTTDGVAK